MNNGQPNELSADSKEEYSIAVIDNKISEYITSHHQEYPKYLLMDKESLKDITIALTPTILQSMDKDDAPRIVIFITDLMPWGLPVLEVHTPKRIFEVVG